MESKEKTDACKSAMQLLTKAADIVRTLELEYCGAMLILDKRDRCMVDQGRYFTLKDTDEKLNSIYDSILDVVKNLEQV